MADMTDMQENVTCALLHVSFFRRIGYGDMIGVLLQWCAEHHCFFVPK
jgi:hypothetical protein